MGRCRQFKTCDCCGASLDFGERCECIDRTKKNTEIFEQLLTLGSDNQYIYGGMDIENYKVKN